MAFPTLFENILTFVRIIDALFVLDIFINFISAYQDAEYNVVDQRKEIAKNYLNSWFLLDLIAVVPFDLFFQTNGNQLVRVTRIGKLYKLVKIFRLLRLVKVI